MYVSVLVIQPHWHTNEHVCRKREKFSLLICVRFFLFTCRIFWEFGFYDCWLWVFAHRRTFAFFFIANCPTMESMRTIFGMQWFILWHLSRLSFHHIVSMKDDWITDNILIQLEIAFNASENLHLWAFNDERELWYVVLCVEYFNFYRFVSSRLWSWHIHIQFWCATKGTFEMHKVSHNNHSDNFNKLRWHIIEYAHSVALCRHFYHLYVCVCVCAFNLMNCEL